MAKSVEDRGVNLTVPHRELVDRAWEQAGPWLERAFLKYGDEEMTLDQLKEIVRHGRAHLLVIKTVVGEAVGALVVQFIDYPKFRSALVLAIGGENLLNDGWLIEQFQQWLNRNGVTKVEAVANDDVTLRLFRRIGLEQVGVFVRGELRCSDG